MTSSNPNERDGQVGEASRVELLELKLKLSYAPPHEVGHILKEIIDLRCAAAPLTPFLVEQFRAGKLSLGGCEIVELYHATQSKDLLEAFRDCGDRKTCDLESKIRLYGWGFDEFEPQLRDQLWKRWDSSGWKDGIAPVALLLRSSIARVFAERGSREALEVLEVILPKLAGMVAEQRARVDSSGVIAAYIDVGTEMPPITSDEHSRYSLDYMFLTVARAAISRMRERHTT